MRYLFGFVCVCALGVVPLVGCSETTGDGGTGGSAGSGGTAGDGGTGGMPECQSDDDCNDGYACTVNTCAEGVCECMPVEDGGGCSFGLMGPLGVCVAGECRGICETAEHCYDGNDCTEDACPIDGGGVCDHTPVADGTTCAGGSCQGGACELTGSVLPCSEEGIRNAVAAGGGPYTFDCGSPTTVVTRATIVVDKDVILDGEGDLTLDGSEDHGVFDFSSKSNGCLDTPPCESEVRVELNGFTVTGGMASTNPAFNVQECVDVQLTRSSVTANAGRGIENAGTLTLTDVTVSDNEEGIFNTVGILNMTNCTVSGNTGTRPGSGGIIGGGTITMTNCTVSGNAGPPREGGGIAVGGALTMTNCTVSGNTAGNNSGDIVFGGQTLTMTNTLVDGACVDVEPTVVTSNGYNIESPGDTCGFAVTVDDLKLGPLQNNGGLTETHALLSGSPAIDQIPAADCVDADGALLTEDQRGEPRPAGAESKCDVGSFERQVPFSCTEQGIRDAIAEGGGPHTFACEGPKTVVTVDTIQVSNNVILDGEGNLTVDGNDDHGVFMVRGPTLELRGFTVTGGAAERGAGIDAGSDYLDGPDGELILVNTIVSGNTASTGGGGIVGGRRLTLTNSTVSGNAAEFGGGIAGNAMLINSTVSGNTAVTDGGGLITTESTLINSTVSGNTAGRKGAAINGRVTLVNSTVAGDMHFGDLVALKASGSVIRGACSEDGSAGPPQTSNGYNIESPGDTCGFDQGTDQVDVTEGQLNLGELADNDGPTMTHALGLLPTRSVAIDHIPAVDCGVTTDQRGEPRPETGGDACDIGAFERQPDDPEP